MGAIWWTWKRLYPGVVSAPLFSFSASIVIARHYKWGQGEAKFVPRRKHCWRVDQRVLIQIISQTRSIHFWLDILDIFVHICPCWTYRFPGHITCLACNNCRYDARKSVRKICHTSNMKLVISSRSITLHSVVVGIGVRGSTGFTVRISASVTLSPKSYRLHDTFRNKGHLKQAFHVTDGSLIGRHMYVKHHGRNL